MTIRTEVHASILPASTDRNVSPATAFPVLSGLRARPRRGGPTLVAAVWMLTLAFFVLAVAVPASVMERKVQESRVARTGP